MTFELCPACGKKGLRPVRNYGRGGHQRCRYCKHFEAHGKHDLFVTAERFTRDELCSLEPKLPTIKMSINVRSGDEKSGHEQSFDLTLEQLQQILDVVSSKEDRIILQRHAAIEFCSCGRPQWTVEGALECIENTEKERVS